MTLSLPIGRAPLNDYGVRIPRCSKPGSRNRRFIVRIVRDGYEHIYHATKGWRSGKL